MAAPEAVAPFFSLPLELREQIYKAVLDSPTQGPDFLQTCREIQAEAFKFLYQRPLKFRSQATLYTWLNEAPIEMLPRVSEISLNIQDIDLKSILRPEPSVEDSTASVHLRTWELYKGDLDRLKNALKKLPNATIFTVRALSSPQSFLYRDFVTEVLEILVSLYPRLLDLRLKGDFHHQDLAFLSNLQSLESFTFDGFSSSSPTETANILAGMTNLSNLSLVSQHGILTPTTRQHSGFTAKRQSLTGDVLRTIHQLASFSVIELVPASSPNLFFTPEVLSSLHDHGSLISLSVSLSYTPDTETLEFLEEFLKHSSIEQLGLDWPDLHPFVLESHRLLTGNLKCLWVRAKSEADAFNILWSIVESREIGDLRELRKIVLIRSMTGHGDVQATVCDKKGSKSRPLDELTCSKSPVADDTDITNIARAKLRLRDSGVHVAWCTEGL